MEQYAHAPARFGCRMFPRDAVARWSKLLDAADMAAKDAYLVSAQIGDEWCSRRTFTCGRVAGEPVMRLVRVR
jgi:hypothetical protein